ncbi:DegT/DnrJ/EryC1/StrS family aminotransferase [Hymenobacter cellulosivorans]|uniref:DegT/DnrJ/EryC1/StrS family aminotransferase n=1 Tax=Hymenobacter cellulosivorans TaxID=2932249 RepID=A0ABY4F3C0_9BACT|nr:DegT/DnrJ/EryC1/StrS family aminotransferase [Hymenobacter cellulosivorans]UOQ51060.1 DegT/DnrJ/EryC1/StrS family aminotransferase [Hymenobacter cellulosivorans]
MTKTSFDLPPLSTPSATAAPIHLLDLGAQHAPIQSEIEAALQQVLSQAAFIQGPAVAEFAQELGAYLDNAHVIPCGNGTDALQLALMSLRLPAGAEVIVPAFTYVATMEAVAILGLRPVCAEVLPDTFCLDPAAVAAAITPRTGAIIAVHLFGQCADLTALTELARQHHLALIEDNAQAIGATWQPAQGAAVFAGTVGEVGTTSFFPSKNLGALGDGGALFTRDAARATYLRQLANHGQTRKYYHEHVGLNSRLDTLQAAVLRVKLRHLPTWTAARQHAAAFYDKMLGGVPGLQVPVRDSRSTHVFHQYTVTVAAGQRDALQEFLRERGIPSVVYYPVPTHLQPAYQYLGYQPEQFPVAEALCRTVLSLPIHPTLSPAQQHYIVEAVKEFLGAKVE